MIAWLGTFLLASLLLGILGVSPRTQGQSIVQHSPTPTPTPKVAGHPPSPPRPTPAPKVAGGRPQAAPTPAPKVAGRPTPTPTPRPNPTAGRVVTAQLSVNAPGKVGQCPAQENFSGAITTNGAAQVTYTWVSFDGGTWPSGTLRFSGPGTQRVSEQVRLGAAGQVVHGWMQLKVLSPNGILSPRAQYTVNCSGGQTAGRVVRAQLTASRSASASCPMQENFNGAITTNGAAQVTYTWTSSDNSTWPQGTLQFASAGTKAVRETWKLGAAGQMTNGWVRLKVLSPNAYMSNQAQFNFRCP
ncbi:MAG TPA: hypothetical protein VI488_02095 [Candidatus Angelobacter sp.]